MKQSPGGVRNFASQGELITTIIPTYRRPDRLKKAIQSVLDQTHPHVQVCVYDNSSSDETAEVVAAFIQKDLRVKYHCHAKDIGAGENFQYGLSHVKTPFFSFLSDDDFLLPEFYETALKGFERYPEAAFSLGAVIDVNDEGEVVDVSLAKWPDREYYTPPDGLLEMIGKYSNWIGTLFRQDVIGRIGPLDLALKAIDVDFMFRAAAQLPFAISKKPCAVFVQHAASYSGHHGLKLIWPGWPVMIEKLTANRLLGQEAKQMVEQKLLVDLQTRLLMNALRSLERNKIDEAASIAELYYQHSSKKKLKKMLSITIKTCRMLPPTQKLIVFLLKVRRFWLRRVQKAHLQTAYRNL